MAVRPRRAARGGGNLIPADGKTRRAIALDELVMAVSVETLEHEEDCRCGLCSGMEAVGG